MAVAKRALALALMIGWFVLGTTASARADAFTVGGIAVDVEADNAVLAREMAIEEAQALGLRQLLERLTLPQYYGQLPAADQQSLTRLVTAFEVEEESTSATRYVGRLSVSYDEAAVQGMLQGTGVPIVLEQPPSLLVVPALDEAEGLAVFTGPEGWRDAWVAEARQNTLLDIRLPVGDLERSAHAQRRGAGERARDGAGPGRRTLRCRGRDPAGRPSRRSHEPDPGHRSRARQPQLANRFCRRQPRHGR
jgi:hypothetical protein